MRPDRQLSPVEVEFRRDGLGILESHHEEGFFMDWRHDPFAKVLILVGGEGVLHKSGGPISIRAPMVVVIPAKSRHRLEDSPGQSLSLYGLCLKDMDYPGTALVRAACASWRIAANPQLCRTVHHLLRQILVEERDPRTGSGDMQLALVCRILVNLARSPETMTGETAGSLHRVEAYIRQMEREFWRPDDLDSVARSLGMSRRRFTELFRQAAGETWLTRITRLRMDHASRLLRESRLTVRSIAFECGYADLAHFYRTFRKQYGSSPGRFRLLP